MVIKHNTYGNMNTIESIAEKIRQQFSIPVVKVTVPAVDVTIPKAPPLDPLTLEVREETPRRRPRVTIQITPTPKE